MKVGIDLVFTILYYFHVTEHYYSESCVLGNSNAVQKLLGYKLINEIRVYKLVLISVCRTLFFHYLFKN